MEEMTMENGYAVGRVCTGFSYPLVALYSAAGETVTLSNSMVLARGVGVDININVAGDNEFYADNALAESENDVFESGNLKLTVDGLFDKANRMISGQGEPTEVTFGQEKVNLTKYKADAKAPYVAVGVIVEYKSAGKRIYTPTTVVKTKFKPAGTSAQTRGKTTSWQTQDLEATIHRAEDGCWKWVGEDYASEAEAKAALNSIFGMPKA
jgi:hypothetical protein